MHPWTLYALEVMNDREREARNNRFAADFREANVSVAERPSRLRRSAALIFAAVSRGSADVVRRLDDCVAEDLGRSLAATE
jgi:hypothetical protein